MKKKVSDTILFIHHSSKLGGAPISLSYIIREYKKNECDITLINIADGPSNEIFRKEGVEPVLIHNARAIHGSTVAPQTIISIIKNLLYFLPTIFSAYKNIKRISPALIHLNSTCLFPFAIAAKIYNKDLPVICHVREPISKGIIGWPLRFFIKKFADGIIAISDYDLQSLKINSSQKQISKTVIYNFVEKPYDNIRNNQFFQNKLAIPEDSVVFLYLARFAKGNGWETLIKSAKLLVKEHPHFHFVLAGAEESMNLTGYETKNIHILHFQKDVSPLLNSADVFVCPFTEPHFARGVIEASAYALPIVANNIGGVNELVLHEQTGFLYQNEFELRQYLTLLGNDTAKRMEFGNNAKEFSSKNFDYIKNIKATTNFINTFL